MLTQRSTPDHKCKLDVLSFLTLTHLLDCLICARNLMPLVLLLQMAMGCDRWGNGRLKLGCRWGNRAWVSSDRFFSYDFVICSLTFSVASFRWLEHDGYGLILCFYFFSSLFLDPLTSS